MGLNTFREMTIDNNINIVTRAASKGIEPSKGI